MATVEIPAWDSRSSFCDEQSQMQLGGAVALFRTPLIFVIFLNKMIRILKNL